MHVMVHTANQSWSKERWLAGFPTPYPAPYGRAIIKNGPDGHLLGRPALQLRWLACGRWGGRDVARGFGRHSP